MESGLINALVIGIVPYAESHPQFILTDTAFQTNLITAAGVDQKWTYKPNTHFMKGKQSWEG
jgi:hypothetical protein